MISVILYGRNDSYGYNLHKRVAISLNCMAEVLTEPTDEILFVDYNTPDDFPTMPEAIQDTLTQRAKDLLKIIRVRENDHRPFAQKTHLKALEPTARNAALRRSNPGNRWVLSTNTDMIFVPQNRESLSEIAKDLPDGHYGIPRFELPETLWESLDRTNPTKIIQDVSEWGWKFHLNEAVLSARPHLFDAPGDFQLMLRQDLFDVDGFDESMLLGWHVDSNIAKRIGLMRGDVGDLSSQIFGYHCDHTRQVTPMHRKSAPSNDLVKYVDALKVAPIEEQRDTWGFNGQSLEIVNLSTGSHVNYAKSLDLIASTPQTKIEYSSYTTESFNGFEITAEHRTPFLVDLIASVSRTTKFLWFGEKDQHFDYLSEAVSTLGFHEDIQHVDISGLKSKSMLIGQLSAISLDNTILIFNFLDRTASANLLARVFSIMVDKEIQRDYAAVSPSRFIGIGVTHTTYEQLWESKIESSKTPFSMGIKHGFIELGLREDASVAGKSGTGRSLLTGTIPGNAGINFGNKIQTSKGVPGCVSYGPYVWPEEGTYRLVIELTNLSATKSHLNVEAVRNIEKRVKGRGDNFWKMLPMAAVFAFVLGRITFSPFGTVYGDIFSNGIKSKKTYAIPRYGKKMKLVQKFEIGDLERADENYLGLDVRLMTSGHYEFKVESITLEKLK